MYSSSLTANEDYIFKIIEFDFLFIDIPAIPERVTRRKGLIFGCQGPGGYGFVLRVVFIFYDKRAFVVNNSHDVALKVVEIGIHRAVEINLSGAGLGVVEKVQIIRSLRQMGNQFAVQAIIRGGGYAVFRYGFPRAQSVVIVLELYAQTGLVRWPV